MANVGDRSSPTAVVNPFMDINFTLTQKLCVQKKENIFESYQ